MGEVSYIKETGKNKFHNYSYATDEDVALAVRPAMVKYGLALLPVDVEVSTVQHSPTAKGAAQWRTDLIYVFELLHTSGESKIVKAPGAGIDGEDKGVYKGITGARKYLLRTLFMIPTGTDPERGAQASDRDTEPDQVESKPVKTDTKPDGPPIGEATARELIADAKLDWDSCAWYCAAVLKVSQPLAELPEPRFRNAVQHLSSKADEIHQAVDEVRAKFRATFFAKWSKLHPIPGDVDEDEKTSIMASIEDDRKAVCEAWYGASLSSIGIRKILKSERGLPWLQSSSLEEFEEAVVQTIGE
jgi:hypothetical protein